MTSSIPEGYTSVTPHMVLKDSDAALKFYAEAFGGEEMLRMPGPGGQGVLHAEMKIGNAMIMMCDEMPQMENWISPESLKGTSVSLALYVDDCDTAFAKAAAAGCTAIMPPMDMFWGDRYSRVRDPFGHEWSLSTHVKDLTPEEMEAGMNAFFANMAEGDCGAPE